MRTHYLLLYSLCYFLDTSDCFNFKKLKDKVQDFKHRHLKPKPEFPALGENRGLEFPGVDVTKLREIQRLWDRYYECLATFNASLGVQRAVTPEAVMALEGTSVRFECKICLSPSEAHNMDAVSWLYGFTPIPVQYGEHVLLSSEDRSLRLFSLRKEDSGQYLCQVGNTVTSPYFLQVVDNEEPILEVRPAPASLGLHPQPPTTLPLTNVKLWTNWERWSPCNQCGKVGKRVRFGACTISLETDVEEKGYQLLGLFRKGVPCRFSFLPADTRAVPGIRDRKSELMTGFCRVPCPGAVGFQVHDRAGHVLETANNSAGIFSGYQGVPTVEPRVERQTIFEYTEQKKIALKCPGNLNTDTPVFWQIGTKRVNPQLIKDESQGRMYVNSRGHFIIRKPRIVDSNIYSCWQATKLAGTIRLDISKRIHLSFNHHIMLLGMVVVMGTFLLVFYRAFKGRKRHLQG